MGGYRLILPIMPAVRKFSLVVLAGALPGILFYGYLFYSVTNVLPGVPENISELAFAAVAGVLVAFALYFTNYALDRLLSWKHHFLMRFLTGYLASTLVALALCTILFKGARILPGDPILWSQMAENTAVTRKAVIVLLVSLFVYNVIYTLLYSYQQYAFAQLENLQSERKQLELQFEALKSQISPHYLFNSLNTISSLLYKDIGSAEQFIRRLAQTYRYILATQNKRLVPLREEIEFVQSYYYLLRIRFQQQLTVEINLPSTILNSWIPPLTLQMLVENAVKHNNPGNHEKILIYISAQDNTYVRVANTKAGTPDKIQSFHFGLENIRKRYAFFTSRKIEVRDKNKFIVLLPVITDEAASDQENKSIFSRA